MEDIVNAINNLTEELKGIRSNLHVIASFIENKDVKSKELQNKLQDSFNKILEMSEDEEEEIDEETAASLELLKGLLSIGCE